MNELNKIVGKWMVGDCDNPDELSKEILILSAHIYTVRQEATKLEIEYARKYEEIRGKYKTEKQTEMGMKLESIFSDLESRKSAVKMIDDLIKSAKKRLGYLQEGAKLNY